MQCACNLQLSGCINCTALFFVRHLSDNMLRATPQSRKVVARHSSETRLVQYAAHEADSSKFGSNAKDKGMKRTSTTGTETTELHTYHFDIEAVDKGFLLAADYIQHLCKTRVQTKDKMLGCVLLRVQSLAEKPKYTAESNSSHSQCHGLEHHQQAFVSQAQTPPSNLLSKVKTNSMQSQSMQNVHAAAYAHC